MKSSYAIPRNGARSWIPPADRVHVMETLAANRNLDDPKTKGEIAARSCR
jgi:hypothetical protein